jgi:hypothetical protein
MAFSFPSNPAVNDTYTVGSRTWTWTGSLWEMTSGLITTQQLTDLGVTTAKINDSAVTTAKIADGAVTLAKVGAGVGGGLDTDAEGAIAVMDIGA